MTFDTQNTIRLIDNMQSALEMSYLSATALDYVKADLLGDHYTGDKAVLINQLMEIKKPLPLSCDAALALQYFINDYEKRLTDELEKEFNT